MKKVRDGCDSFFSGLFFGMGVIYFWIECTEKEETRLIERDDEKQPQEQETTRTRHTKKRGTVGREGKR